MSSLSPIRAEHGRVGDLVAIERQDGQDARVSDGVDELVRVPARRKQAVSAFAGRHDDTAHEEVGVISDCPVGVARA